MAGTKEYLNIELLRQRECINHDPLLVGPEYDYWAIGVFVYEMFCRETPFYDKDDDRMMNNIINYRYTLHFPPDINIPETAKDLISNLITEPSKRLTYDDLIKHPFFKDVDFATLRQCMQFL
ncbi:unnamed protein product [Protopolystoma xenopodis]|uniref:Protein kinase domain-containing protein n=1 Tax=Protopolystoma xenopodis TaxID=117903 RepID=A0A448WS85_9PLAT|nr:unnamed protein product [Protopolystoma xenopodis]